MSNSSNILKLSGGLEKAINAGYFIWSNEGIDWIVKTIIDESCITVDHIDYKKIYEIFNTYYPMKYESFTSSMADHAEEIISRLQSLGINVKQYPYKQWDHEDLDILVSVIINSNSINPDGSLNYKKLVLAYSGKKSEINLRTIVKKYWSYIEGAIECHGICVYRTNKTIDDKQLLHLSRVVSFNGYRDSSGRILWGKISKEIFPGVSKEQLRRAYYNYVKVDSEP